MCLLQCLHCTDEAYIGRNNQNVCSRDMKIYLFIHIQTSTHTHALTHARMDTRTRVHAHTLSHSNTCQCAPIDKQASVLSSARISTEIRSVSPRKRSGRICKNWSWKIQNDSTSVGLHINDHAQVANFCLSVYRALKKAEKAPRFRFSSREFRHCCPKIAFHLKQPGRNLTAKYRRVLSWNSG